MAENDIKAQYFNAKADSTKVGEGFEASNWNQVEVDGKKVW
jgi:hypothetical protein